MIEGLENHTCLLSFNNDNSEPHLDSVKTDFDSAHLVLDGRTWSGFSIKAQRKCAAKTVGVISNDKRNEPKKPGVPDSNWSVQRGALIEEQTDLQLELRIAEKELLESPLRYSKIEEFGYRATISLT